MTIPPDPQTIAALLREAQARGTQPRLGVTSSSMAPTLRAGDQVIVEAVQPDDLRLGDILVIQRERDLLTHRLVALDQEAGCHTKGDGDAILDPFITPQEILGRVILVERGQAQVDFKRPVWRMVNPILGKLGWWEAQLYPIAPIARLPIRLIMRIILWLIHHE